MSDEKKPIRMHDEQGWVDVPGGVQKMVLQTNPTPTRDQAALALSDAAANVNLHGQSTVRTQDWSKFDGYVDALKQAIEEYEATPAWPVTSPVAAQPIELGVWHNDCDWVVAASAEDARAVWAEHTGELAEAYDAEDWTRWKDDRPLKMMLDDVDGKFETKTCAEWVAGGRRYLGSTEY